MAQSLSQVVEDDRRIRSHTRRAVDELTSALMIARAAGKMNPRARGVETELARVLHNLENMGTLASKYPIEPEPARVSASDRHKEEREKRKAAALALAEAQGLAEGDEE